MDWDRCGNTCTTTPYTVWKKYTRKVSTVTAKDTITTEGGITVKCTSYTETPIKTFSKFPIITGYEETRTLVYSYRTKTRSTYTDIKWSSYNDSLLLSQGYKMTGNKRVSN